jgi:hypothetical protein
VAPPAVGAPSRVAQFLAILTRRQQPGSSPNVVIRGLTFVCALSLLLVIGGASAWNYLAPRSADHPWLSRGIYALATVALTFGLLNYFNILIFSRTIPFVPLIIASAAALFALAAALSSAADKTRSRERAAIP